MIAVLAAAALAQTTPPPPTPPEGEGTRYFELTMTAGPVLGQSLPGVQQGGVLPMAELFFESRQGKNGGLGMYGGFGTIDQAVTWELGLGGRGYPVGTFQNGMVLGAEVVFVHQGERGEIEPESGLSFGPVLGFKLVAPFGLTVDVTGGASVMFYGTGFDTARQGWGPIANAHLGWSV